MGAWGERHRDALLYSIALVGLVCAGFLWKGMLSLVLAPFWMLLVVWLVPRWVGRLGRARR